MENNQTTPDIRFLLIDLLKPDEQAILRALIVNGADIDQMRTAIGRLVDERNNTPIPAPTGSITFDLPISVNNRYGNSAADIIYAALIAYRQSTNTQLLDEMVQGAYECVFDSHRLIQDINDTIDLFVEGLSVLANKNYWAIEGETADGGDVVKTDNQHRYENFINEYGLSRGPRGL